MGIKTREKGIINIIKKNSEGGNLSNFEGILKNFAENVFTLKTMRRYLSEETYNSLLLTMRQGQSLKIDIAEPVANAMKDWAIENGATHYTHWFQPLTGSTAEKHDSFLNIDKNYEIKMSFSGKTLIKGEPDASSFPSGGLRSTFEARGYTAWDPTSPAFIKKAKNGSTLCIPTAFYSYNGDALDKKIPVLKSTKIVSEQVKRLMKCFGQDTQRVITTLGAEQEYFLIDKQLFYARQDLVQCGRTLFGTIPAKHQQMEDHYFGNIKQRVLDCMMEVDIELWRLGIPVKTRHNEVAPSQYEIAAEFEELNLAVDHNMIVMETLKLVASRHGLICLLNEKPFTGINGSGKHNNWSIATDGVNLFNPGKDVKSNLIFLTSLCAVLAGVDEYAELLRATVATAGNEHRLGASEAPPAIISIFLGEKLTEILTKIELGSKDSEQTDQKMQLGVDTLPNLPLDITDRNRTSPFAFTGNKFEFRAVGSEQTCAGPTVVLNLIFADALANILDQLENIPKENFNSKLQSILKNIIKKHKRIIFNGDNYSAEWEEEAKKRGLSNIVDTDSALDEMISEKSIKLFKKYGLLSLSEITSRHQVYKEIYQKTKLIEGKVVVKMTQTSFLPAAVKYMNKLLSANQKLAVLKGKSLYLAETIEKIKKLIDDTYSFLGELEVAISNSDIKSVKIEMDKIRKNVDTLELIVDDELWPVPKYSELLFIS